MSNGRQFGYPQGEPNAPFRMREVMNKCEGCGNVFVDVSSRTCLTCAVAALPEIRVLVNNASDALAHYDKEAA